MCVVCVCLRVRACDCVCVGCVCVCVCVLFVAGSTREESPAASRRERSIRCAATNP
jgi:hypothetical protein